MPVGKVEDWIQVHGAPEGVYSDNGARPVRDGACHALGCEIERPWIDVREYRPGPPVKNGIGNGDESKGWENHFVASPIPKAARPAWSPAVPEDKATP